MAIRNLTAVGLILSLASLNCGADAGSDPTGAGAGAGAPTEAPAPEAVTPETPSPVDSAPPTVLAISPANGAKGVRADAKVVITFSEPMDAAATEAAYLSQELPSAAATLTWNATGTELTVTPKAALAYAKAADPLAAAQKYAVAVGVGAKDRAGNSLAAPATSEFSTLREFFLAPPLVPAASGRLTVGNSLSAVAGTPSYFVGDGDANQTTSAFFTFDIASIPEGAEVAEASFATRQLAVTGAPFTDLGAGALLARTSFATFAGNPLNNATVSSIGTLSTAAALGPRQLVVTAAVASDLSERVAKANRSQFRLAFAAATDNGADIDRADFLTPELSVTYLLP